MLALVVRPRFNLAVRVEVLVISGLLLSVAGIALSRIASTPVWRNVVFPPTHDGVPTIPMAVATLTNNAPEWAILMLIVGLGALWIGSGWALFRRHKEAIALD